MIYEGSTFSGMKQTDEKDISYYHLKYLNMSWFNIIIGQPKYETFTITSDFRVLYVPSSPKVPFIYK